MINIRPATSSDAEGISHVQQQTWLATYPNEKAGVTLKDITDHIATQTVEKWKQSMGRENSKTWVAEDKGIIVGFCVARKCDDKHHLQTLYILDSHQRQGIGQKLTQHALDWLGPDKDTYVRVVDYNHKALRFYKKLGFVENRKDEDSEWYRFPSGNVLKGITLKKSASI